MTNKKYFTVAEVAAELIEQVKNPYIGKEGEHVTHDELELLIGEIGYEDYYVADEIEGLAALEQYGLQKAKQKVQKHFNNVDFEDAAEAANFLWSATVYDLTEEFLELVKAGEERAREEVVKELQEKYL